jgi:hypothetical protein
MRNNMAKERKDTLKNKIEFYIETLEEQCQNNKKLAERRSKDLKNLGFSEYCQTFGLLLKAEHQEKQLRKYEENITLTKQLLQDQ